MAATQHGFKLVQGHGGPKWLLDKLAIKWLLSSMHVSVAFGGELAKMAFAAAAAHSKLSFYIPFMESSTHMGGCGRMCHMWAPASSVVLLLMAVLP